MIYAGVGSRKTPKHVRWFMRVIACRLAEKGYTLRSGGAKGADKAFEGGAIKGEGRREIYLPWQGYEDRKSKYCTVDEAALVLAATIHPNWDANTDGGKKLHARNCYQILGRKLDSPVDFVICWTPNGRRIGGTLTAIVLAERYNIPVYNLARGEDWLKIAELVTNTSINLIP